MGILKVFSVIINLIAGARYFLEIKSKGLELGQVYESLDREEKIHKEIEQTVVKKDEARKKQNEPLVKYYGAQLDAFRRKLHNQHRISNRLEQSLKRGN